MTAAANGPRGRNAVARVSAHLDALVSHGRTPGLQYVVTTADGPIFTYAGGMADLRSRRPMMPDTTLMAYSMSKTITAAAVLRQVAGGRVGLDDPIDRYIATPYGPGVTVGRLLNHTAGLPNPIPLGWVHRADDPRGFDERAALASVMARHRSLASQPGRRFRYSNLGYWLLGPVVERGSGQPFTTDVEEQILAPLGLSAGALGYAIHDRARHATGYLEKWSFLNLIKRLVVDPRYVDGYDGRWLRLHPHYLNGPAFGGLIGSASAFAVFLADQLRDESAVLPASARQLFYTIAHTCTGQTVPMTFGWHVGEGGAYYFKEGGGGGFHSMMRLYSAAGLGTVVIANATQCNVGRLLDAVDREFLP